MNSRMMERDAPPEVQALMRAYRETTGMPVSLTPDRCHALLAILQRGEPPLGPDDVKAVVAVIKKDLATDRPRFSRASLEFRNLLGNADVFEERALACRQWSARKAAGKPKAPVAQTDQAGVTRLVDPVPAEPVVAGKLLAGVLRELATQAEGGGR